MGRFAAGQVFRCTWDTPFSVFILSNQYEGSTWSVLALDGQRRRCELATWTERALALHLECGFIHRLEEGSPEAERLLPPDWRAQARAAANDDKAPRPVPSWPQVGAVAR